MSSNEILHQIYEDVVSGRTPNVKQGVQSALDLGVSANEVLQGGLIAAMAEVGARFERNEFFVPEMLISARAMQAGLAILKPLLAEQGVKAVGKVAIGTVKGDLHDIGKSLVAMMLEGAGFEIVDLGVDVTPEKFVAAARDGVDLVAMSALLTTTMVNMQNTIQALETAGLRNNVKVLIGGAPITEAYAHQIEADAYAPDASSAVTRAKGLLGV
jgi:5-methyltetrahydrofolate--homocysteine methyltransferase